MKKIKIIKKSHLVISGANGFVGSRLLAHLRSKGFTVTSLVRPGYSFIDKENQSVEVDLSDKKCVVDLISSLNPDYFIHLAGNKNRVYSSLNAFDQYLENTKISNNVIVGCLNLKNFTRFIFIGSCDEYGLASGPFLESQRESPVNLYGFSKLAITKMLSVLYAIEKFPCVVLRPTVIYGPGQGQEMFLSSLIKSLVSGSEFEMTLGEQYRDFLYIDDVINAIIMVLYADDLVNGNIFNIGSGNSMQVKEVALLAAKIIGNNSSNLIKFGAIPYRANEVMDYSVNIEHAYDLLGWKPEINLESGLVQTVQYFNSLAQ
jgi:UDP-glucose 4-epimerase